MYDYIDINSLKIEIEPKVDLEVSFDSLQLNASFFKTQERVIITNCPSNDEILENLPNLMKLFFNKFTTAICVEFKIIQNFLELTDEQLTKMIKNFLSFKRSFLVAFKSNADNSCVIYWRLKDKLPIFKLNIEANKVELENFVIEFLLEFLKRNQNGELRMKNSEN